MKYSEARIGMEVLYHVVDMVITGLFSCLSDLGDCTAYLDYEGNDGDLCEVDLSEVCRK